MDGRIDFRILKMRCRIEDSAGSNAPPEELSRHVQYHHLANSISDIPQPNEPESSLSRRVCGKRVEVRVGDCDQKARSETSVPALRLHEMFVSTGRL